MKLPIDLRGMEMKACPVEEDYNKRGPSVHLEWDEPYDFPDEGTMTVKFKVRRREEEISNKKKTYETALELVEITSIKSEGPMPPASGEGEAGKALDRLREEMED